MGQPETEAAVRKHLHDARMATYLKACSGDPRAALELYRWNTRISGALFETLTVTEVIFRNAVDDALRAWNIRQPGAFDEDWTTKAAAPLNGLVRRAVSVARNQAKDARARRAPGHPRKFAEITHDDIVAQLSLGSYARIFPTADPEHADYERRLILWNEALCDAFKGRVGDAWEVHHGRIERLLTLRNRVAHGEPVLDVNLKGRARDMVRLTQSINPLLAGWLSGTTRIHDEMRTRPSLKA